MDVTITVLHSRQKLAKFFSFTMETTHGTYKINMYCTSMDNG